MDSQMITLKDIFVLMPEITLLVMGCLTLMVDLYVPKCQRILTYVFSQFSVVLTAVACWYFPFGNGVTAFGGQFAADAVAVGLKTVILGMLFLTLLYSRLYTAKRDIAFGEFYVLALFSALGMMCLVSAKSLLMIYLGLELMSLCLYALVALQKNSSVAVEAGMKYFVMGALASGMLLYGMSLLFGLTGSIQLDQLASFAQNTQGNTQLVVLFAFIFVLAGVAFKLGVVPFHMWIPDVYQGAPTSITLLLSSAPKIAAFGMAYRIFNDALPSVQLQWNQIFIVIAILSLAIGNIGAIVQTNVKRLLGYSTIAHMGFLFLGILVAPTMGYGPAMYYIVVYALVACCAFGILIKLSQDGEADTFTHLNGLATRSPWLALLMLLVAFSLAGVPPTVGFYAKFMVLSALVDAGYTWLAAVAVIFSVIGAFYYLRIVRAMYFEAPQTPYVGGGAWDFKAVLSLNGLAVLGLGLVPAPLYLFCQQLMQSSPQ